MKLGILASGNLGFIVLKLFEATYQLDFVMTDKNSQSIIDFCNTRKIKLFIGNPRNGNAEDFISTCTIDVLLSVNYLFIVDKDLISLPNKIAFNIHGSLLPKYRGRTPHVWAIINNEKSTGITAHLIDEGCDTGNIIEQIEVPIYENETGATILEKFNDLYIPLIESVLNKLANNTLITKPQNNDIATYFGKRTEDDGRIDWNWQKERIKNWVRAQAYPYPGAFTFYENEKIIIDEIEFFEFAFHQEMANGYILNLNPLLVKTPNGVVSLKKVRTNKNNFELLKSFN